VENISVLPTSVNEEAIHKKAIAAAGSLELV
jgi:hypothetical protein